MNENQKAQVLDTLKAIKDATDKERAGHIAQLKNTLTEWNETGPDGWAAAVKEALEATGGSSLETPGGVGEYGTGPQGRPCDGPDGVDSRTRPPSMAG